jgi:uncharacterized membrane protein
VRPGSTGTDALTGQTLPRRRLVALATLRPTLVDLIRADHPDIADDALIALETANAYRSRYVEQLLRRERGTFSEVDAEIVQAIAKQETLAGNVDEDFARTRSVGEQASDLIASFGGSWMFILLFAAFLAGWMMWNAARGTAAFDPFPYILLNLILSTLAAIQAPIIMMSQRRQEMRDRLRARSDYQVNLKAELEIRMLHEKLDDLIAREWQRLEEARNVQIELLEATRKRH